MRVVEGLAALDALDLVGQHGDSAIESRSAVLIGVFDGVHLGHQRLLHELVELGSETESLPTVVSFQNHPDELLHGAPDGWLTSLPHRLRLLRRAGVRRTVLLTFDDAVRAMSARAFAERILVGALRTRGLLIGYDSAIGKDREGTVERMAELGAELGFVVREGSTFMVDGATPSSSTIRDAIRAGDLALAQRMLGRWPSVYGEVVHGDGRGRTLGFPTANVAAQTDVLPPPGVYAVEVLCRGETRAAVANLGQRPTFGGAGGAQHLEVHVLDRSDELYGEMLEVAFVQRLRDERAFESPGELTAQIALDVEAARRALGPSV